MGIEQDNRGKQIVYHVYLNLHGPEPIYEELYRYLESIGAQKLGQDYPGFWYFKGRVDNWEQYQEDIFRAINSNVPRDTLNHPEVAWRVLLMGPNGHNSCAGGFCCKD